MRDICVPEYWLTQLLKIALVSNAELLYDLNWNLALKLGWQECRRKRVQFPKSNWSIVEIGLCIIGPFRRNLGPRRTHLVCVCVCVLGCVCMCMCVCVSNRGAPRWRTTLRTGRHRVPARLQRAKHSQNVYKTTGSGRSSSPRRSTLQIADAHLRPDGHTDLFTVSNAAACWKCGRMYIKVWDCRQNCECTSQNQCPNRNL